MNRILGMAASAVVLLSACDQPTAPDGAPSNRHRINAAYVAVPGDAIAHRYCHRDSMGDGNFETFCEIYISNADGSGSMVTSVWVDPYLDPPFQSRQTWSPDGSRIAYESSSDIVWVAVDGSSSANLMGGPGSRSPAWSPDGERIAFASNRDGPLELYLMNAADGSNVTRLTNGAGVTGDGNPTWSPDGSRIAFDCEVEVGNGDICVINSDGTGLVRLTIDPASEREADFSPGGTRIALTRNAMITVMDADGANVTPLTEGSQPDWSPSGNRLVFVRLAEGGTGVCDAGGYTWCGVYTVSDFYIINADGTNEGNVGRGSGPAWRPGTSSVINAPPVAEFTSSCTDLTCYFHSTSTDDHRVVSFAWTFGNGATSTSSDPGVSYTATGTYDVTLVVGDFGGQTSSVTHSVSVIAPPPNDPPIAAFTVSCTGKTCTFDSSESSDDHGIVSRDWGFNDGMGPYSTDVVAVHPYLYGGYYRVRLTVYDARGLSSTVYHDVLIVNEAPVPLFTASCTALDCSFDSRASTDDYGITRREWYFGDGTTAGDNWIAGHRYANAGTYAVTLVAYDFDGRWTAVSHEVVVVAPPPDLPPVARFAASCSGLACGFESATSTDDVGIVSRAWNFGDGTSASDVVAPSHSYGADGTYAVTLAVTDTKGQTNTAMQTVAVAVPDSPPVARFTASCAVATCTFESGASSDDREIFSRAWTFGDGTSAGDVVAPNHSYVVNGTYTVTLTVTDTKGQTNSVTQSVTVADQPPVARFTASCVDLTCSFQSDASTDDMGIASRAWTFGDGTSAGDVVAPSHTYEFVSLPYSVTFTVTDTKGQTNNVTHTVTVTRPDAPPVAHFTASCSGLTCSFYSGGSSDDIGIVSRAWTFGDGTSAGDVVAPSHSYGAGGTYPVTLTVTDTKGQTNSATQTVTVTRPDAPPVARFTASCSGLVCSFQSDASTDDVGIVSRGWSFGDGTYGGDLIAPSHTYGVRGGTYAVTLTVTDKMGQSNSVTQSVTAVDQPPVARFTYTCAAPARGQTSCTFDGRSSSDDVGVSSYSWTLGTGGAATGAVVTTSFKSRSTQVITLTVKDAAGQSTSVSQTITVK